MGRPDELFQNLDGRQLLERLQEHRLFAVVSILLINVLAFFIAYALTQKMRGSNLFRTVFFMPNLIGGVVLGYIWSMILTAFCGTIPPTSPPTPPTASGAWSFWWPGSRSAT